MDFSEDIILENDIAYLRPYNIEDMDLLTKYSIHEPELWTYSLLSAAGVDNMKTYFDKALIDRHNGTSYAFIIKNKRNNEYAGSSRFYDYQATHNTVQLGYTWYGQAHQGTGLNKNCKYLMLQFAFEQWGVERVEFRADNGNARSIAAMKSIGCKVEGVLRSNCQGHTSRRDSIILSILKDEWFDSVKSDLKAKIGLI